MDEPLSEADLKLLCRSLVDMGSVRFSHHAFEEMKKDDIVEIDATNIIRGGVYDGCDFERGTWRYRIRTPAMVVVVTFPHRGVLVVVTAWRVRR